MESVRRLEQKKQQIEAELDGLVEFLTSPGMPGLSGPLVDQEGYPRADCDVYAVRHARHRIAVLKTDYAEVCREIENALEQLHAASRVAVPRRPAPTSGRRQPGSLSEEVTNGISPAKEKPAPTGPAFGIIDAVSEGSPAEACGLRVGDAVVAFGPVSLAQCGSTTQCFEHLPRHVIEGQHVEVRVIRESGSAVDISLVPRQWAGRGLLGCHLKPT